MLRLLLECSRSREAMRGNYCAALIHGRRYLAPTGEIEMEIRMRLVSSFVAVLLSACATPLPTAPLDPKHLDQSTNFIGPNGGTAYLMQCFDGIGCYQRAKEACTNGYTIFDSIDSTGGNITNGGGLVGSGHYIAFECKK